ncbi:hypothetical protein D3C77_563150 [compost metagenome]
MLGAAELGALAAKHPLAIGLQAHPMPAPRRHVQFAAQARHPERVDHVGTAHLDIHGHADRQDELVGGHHVALRIAHFPPPLMAGDFQAKRCLAQRQHPAGGVDAVEQQRADAQRGQQQPAADQQAALDTPCLRLRILARRPEQRVQPEHTDQQQHQPGHAAHHPPEARQLAGRGAGRVER